MTFSSVISTDLALALARALVGLVIAAHGAQKTFGLWGGPGIGGWTAAMDRMAMRPRRLWAYLTAGIELLGGVALALGFLTPLVAGAITMQMIAAMHRAHWAKGFWNTKGGIEFTLVLAGVVAFVGIADPGAWSLDRALGLPALGVGAYLIVLALAWLAYMFGARARTASTNITKQAA